MKVLVTGDSGFIGRSLLLRIPKDWEIVAAYLSDGSFLDFIEEQDLNHVTPLRIDLSDVGSLTQVKDLFKSYDACVYLAANGDPAFSEKAPIEDLKSNTRALLNTVQSWTFGNFLYFSSGAVYDGLRGNVNPQSALAPYLPYAISKWAAERYMLHAQRSGKIKAATAIRFFGAFGPYENPRKIYGRLVKQFGISRNPKFTIRGNGQNLIDAMYIDDLTRAIMLLLDTPIHKTQTLDLYSGNRISIETLVRKAAEIFQIEPQIEFVGSVAEFIEFQSNDPTMAHQFNFQPEISLRDGLTKFYNWMKEQIA